MNTDYTVYFYSTPETPIAVAHCTYFSDAVALAEALPNSTIIDAHTGEILRTYDKSKITYFAKGDELYD